MSFVWLRAFLWLNWRLSHACHWDYIKFRLKNRTASMIFIKLIAGVLNSDFKWQLLVIKWALHKWFFLPIIWWVSWNKTVYKHWRFSFFLSLLLISIKRYWSSHSLILLSLLGKSWNRCYDLLRNLWINFCFYSWLFKNSFLYLFFCEVLKMNSSRIWIFLSSESVDKLIILGSMLHLHMFL